MSSMMPIPFMSVAPRPQMKPSRTSPPSGSTVQCSRSNGTTSVWLRRIRGLPREPSPGNVATIEARLSPGSYSVNGIPSRSKISP